jgi:hypothetical protein
MKKIFLLLVASIMAVLPMLADNDKMITLAELPETAQMFIDKHFANIDILYAKAERDMGVITSYDVMLDSDIKLEFNRKGEWESVDCHRSRVPDSLLPKGVLDYVNKKFTKAYVVEIERDIQGYDVKLNNDLDLEFDRDGNFLRID